ncbi:MAG: DPP IV N-terminal domain-containing protein [Bacteroidales bacterium]|jgi:dipeptidyl-peptidase-4|nr:DPP IV N-terminal domain-containing protein [Bacteroidales bacterium]
MIRTIFILLTVITLIHGVEAQDKVFSAADYLNRELTPKSLTGLSWRTGNDAFTWVDNKTLLQKSVGGQAVTDTLLDLEVLNSKMRELGQSDLSVFPAITWKDMHSFFFISQNSVFLYDLSSSRLSKVNGFGSPAENVTISDNSLNIAYTAGNRLFVAVGGEIISVNGGDEHEVVYGQVPSRNEFGINAGIYWSPGGEKIAFYRIDQSEVTDYPLVDISGRIAESSPIKYPMAGMKSEKLSLGIFDPSQNEIVYLQTEGPENQYITSVTWDPSGRFIYAGILNRDQNHLCLNKYDALTGRLVKTLFEEKNERYVEPMHGLYFLPGRSSEFIWQSSRDGWNHLYLYDTEGNLIRQITKGKWEVVSLTGCDPKANSVFYVSNMESPLDKHLYSTELKTGETERLTSGEGVHSIIAHKDMNWFIDVFSGLQMAKAYYLINGKGEKVSTLLEDTDPYMNYKTGEMSIFSIKADDGATDLWCRLIKPVGFNPSVKYPVFVYVYGGPHVQMIDKSWTGGAGFFLNFMAQQGYVVFTLDNRGSDNRGFDFESIIHRQLGEIEMADQMAGIRYLKALSFADTSRIGVYGWSYGGFMTINMMLRNPGVFRTACAGGPVIDWKWYEVMYGERYMDTPVNNPEGYRKSSLLSYAGDLEGKLLIIHGTSDPTVVWQNSLAFVDECIRQGKQVDYFVYPGSGHNMAGRARVHLFEKIAGFFNDYLK